MSESLTPSRSASNDTGLAAHALVVDDDADVLELLSIYLSKAGYKVTKMTSSTEALKLAKTEMFDLFVLDIIMPDLDGFGLSRALKETSVNALAPVLYVSGFADSENVRIEAYDSGASTILSKPVHKEELLAATRALLRRDEDARNSRRLQGKMPLMSALADSLSHSISNPLVALRLAAFHLNKKAAAAEVVKSEIVSEYTRKIELSSEVIGNVIADLTAVARGATSGSGHEQEPLTIDRIVAIVVTLSRMRFGSTGITVTQRSAPPETAGMVSAQSISVGGVVCALIGAIDDAVFWLSSLSETNLDKTIYLGSRLSANGLAEIYLLSGAWDDKKLSAERQEGPVFGPDGSGAFDEYAFRGAVAADASASKRADWTISLHEAKVFAKAAGAALETSVSPHTKITRLVFPYRI